MSEVRLYQKYCISLLIPHIDVGLLLYRRGGFHSLQPERLSPSYVGLVQSLLDQKSRDRNAITPVFISVLYSRLSFFPENVYNFDLVKNQGPSNEPQNNFWIER